MVQEFMFPFLEVVVHHGGRLIGKSEGNWQGEEGTGVQWDSSRCLDEEERSILVYALMSLVVTNLHTWSEIEEYHALFDEQKAQASKE